MITLQALLAHTANVANPATGENATAENTASPFITALGSRLLTLVNQQSEQPLADTPDIRAAKPDSDKASLNRLLEALDKSDSLNALLPQPDTKVGLKSADDNDRTHTTSLNASDLQNMQALFAMLPAMVEQRASLPADSLHNHAAEQPGSGSNATSGNALLAGITRTTQGLADAAGSKPDADLPGLSALSAGVETGADSGAAMPDAGFKAVAGVSSRDTAQTLPAHQDQEMPVSALLSSAPLNSHSALQNTPLTPMLSAQLGSHEWQQALGQQIVMFSRNGQHNAELRLHPEDLGALQITLTMDKDQAQLTLVSGHSHVRAALEAALPQLRSALAESGINLGQSQVSSDAFAQGQQHASQQQSQRDSGHSRFSEASDNENEITPVAVPAALQARAAGSGGVDIFA